MGKDIIKEYKQQLKSGCQLPICHGIFCRKEMNEGISHKISEILSKYGKMFLCENIQNIIDDEILSMANTESASKPLDFFFDCKNKMSGPSVMVSPNIEDGPSAIKTEVVSSYLKNFKKEPVVKLNVDKADNNMSRKKVCRSSETMQGEGTIKDKFKHLNLENNSMNNLISESKKHNFCDFFSQNISSDEDKHILAGVIQLLLKKYESKPYYGLGLIIVRLFTVSSKNTDLDAPYYSILYKIFCNIHSLCSGIVKNQQFTETYICKGVRHKTNQSHAVCLYSPKFTKNDLINLTECIGAYLNKSEIVDSRENRKVDCLLNMFHLLYLINSQSGVLSYKKFYLSGFCSKMSFREEFKYFRTKSKTPLSFPFILPLHIKAELIKYENNDKMKASLQDSFFRSLFEGHVDPYLFITVDRQTLYRDSLRIFKRLKPNECKKQLRTTFRNEEGVDSGGIRKEYFQLLSQEIKHDENLFEHTENRIWIKVNSGNDSSYEAIGRIIGIALYNNVVLNVPFPSVFFKKLLEKKLVFDDLKEIEPEIANSLRNIKKLSKSELNDLDLRFVIDYEQGGKLKKHNLVEDGENKKVTSDNIKLFIEKYAEFYTSVIVEPQFEAIKRGFYATIDKNTVSYLDPKELEKIMMGSNEFDIKAIKSTTTYSGYKENSLIVQYFWEIFESYDRKKKKKLLQFITGNDRIPVSGSASLRLVIMKNGCDTDRLPSSQTCFNTLLLPEYSSKEKFEEKLEKALLMTAGFFLL